MLTPRRTVDLRRLNYQVILRTIYLNGSMSRLDLSSRADLSPSTVTNMTSEMIKDGVLIEKGVEESLGGRPRTILTINPEYGYLVGIDLGETHVQLELFDLTLNKLGTSREPILFNGDTADKPKKYVEIIAANLEKLVASSGIRRESVIGVGIGVPGVVEHDGQVNVAAPIWAWKSIGLLKMLEERLGLPVYIDNGAKAMALAESRFGAGRGVQELAVILLGTGIGAGIITKGALYRGATNSAGEWGHTKIELNGRACRCGSNGCLESYAGAPGIIATYNELAPQHPLPAGDEIASMNQLLQAYRQKDPLACQVFESTSQALGAGIANLVNLFNPEKIVIGGWVGMLVGEAILEDIIQFIKEYALPSSSERLQIGLCQFGQDAICTGAACLVLEEFLTLNEKFNR
jgi:glucokinase-like ROK family protein